MTMTPPSAANRKPRVLEVRAHPPAAKARALLAECFALFEARLAAFTRSTLEMSDDLFEADTNVAEEDVADFLRRRQEWIAPLVLASTRAMSLAHWPPFQRSHNSAFCAGDNPGRPTFAMCAPPHPQIRSEGVASNS